MRVRCTTSRRAHELGRVWGCAPPGERRRGVRSERNRNVAEVADEKEFKPSTDLEWVILLNSKGWNASVVSSGVFADWFCTVNLSILHVRVTPHRGEFLAATRISDDLPDRHREVRRVQFATQKEAILQAEHMRSEVERLCAAFLDGVIV